MHVRLPSSRLPSRTQCCPKLLLSHRACLPHLCTLDLDQFTCPTLWGWWRVLLNCCISPAVFLDREISWFQLNHLQKELQGEGQHNIWSTNNACVPWLVLQILCGITKVKCLSTWTHILDERWIWRASFHGSRRTYVKDCLSWEWTPEDHFYHPSSNGAVLISLSL